MGTEVDPPLIPCPTQGNISGFCAAAPLPATSACQSIRSRGNDHLDFTPANQMHPVPVKTEVQSPPPGQRSLPVAGLPGTKLRGKQARDPVLAAAPPREDRPGSATVRRSGRGICGRRKRPLPEPRIRFFLCSFGDLRSRVALALGPAARGWEGGSYTACRLVRGSAAWAPRSSRRSSSPPESAWNSPPRPSDTRFAPAPRGLPAEPARSERP